MLLEKRERWGGACCACPIEVDGWENSEGRCCVWFWLLVLPLVTLASNTALSALNRLLRDPECSTDNTDVLL